MTSLRGRARNRADKRELVTPGNAKKAIAIGKIVVPVLAPILMQLAGLARGAWDERRARRLGVAPGELNRYSGKGGALHARISRAASSLRELDTRARTAEASRFVTATAPRLDELAAAVRAAELMPTERRRSAHRAVAGELDRIEPKLLALLGVSSGSGSLNGSSARPV